MLLPMTLLVWRVTIVAQCAKAPGIDGYFVGSIPAVTPRDCTITTINAPRSPPKTLKNTSRMVYGHR
jgi:hypothetical protein